MVGFAEATSSGYREKGRFEILDEGQLSWAHPVISDGRLYVRNQDTLLAIRVAYWPTTSSGRTNSVRATPDHWSSGRGLAAAWLPMGMTPVSVTRRRKRLTR